MNKLWILYYLWPNMNPSFSLQVVLITAEVKFSKRRCIASIYWFVFYLNILIDYTIFPKCHQLNFTCIVAFIFDLAGPLCKALLSESTARSELWFLNAAEINIFSFNQDICVVRVPFNIYSCNLLSSIIFNYFPQIYWMDEQ